MEKQNRNRSRQIIFRVTEDEYRIIRRKMIMSRIHDCRWGNDLHR